MKDNNNPSGEQDLFINKYLLKIERLNREGFVKELNRIIEDIDVRSSTEATLIDLKSLRDIIKNYDSAILEAAQFKESSLPENADESAILKIGDDLLTKQKEDPNHIIKQFNKNEALSYNTGFHNGFLLGYRKAAVTDVYEGVRAIKILKELCQLKHYKDVVGKDSFYTKSQPLAWKRANDLLNSLVEQHPVQQPVADVVKLLDWILGQKYKPFQPKSDPYTGWLKDGMSVRISSKQLYQLWLDELPLNGEK